MPCGLLISKVPKHFHIVPFVDGSRYKVNGPVTTTEFRMHCFNDRVREVPKISPDIILERYETFGKKCMKILKFWRTELLYAQNKKMLLLGMDTCPSLNDIMEIRCNKCTRSEQGYDF
jgi:hypothetical protein